MVNWKNFIRNKTIRFINYGTNLHNDHTIHEALSSFAIDDALATSIGEEDSPPTIRLWIHDKTVVLGIPDARLPYIENGINFIKEQGYEPIVRNSGGLAVALDEGVLNISLIFPNSQSTSIHSSYDLMLDFIRDIFKEHTNDIQAYEIVGSYCPGDYDLSIDGIKFAGISQRRVKNGIAVQIYIDVCGNSSERAELVKEFYEISLQNEKTPYEYPTVNPDVMGSLSQLLNKQLRVNDVIIAMKETLNKLGYDMIEEEFSQKEKDTYEKRLAQMIKRNEFL